MLCPLTCVAALLLAADTTPKIPPAVIAAAVEAPAPPAPVAPESLVPYAPAALPPSLTPVSPALPAAPAPLPAVLSPSARMDTVPDRMVEYSDAYYTRLTIHRYASYATLPLFVAQYIAGDQLARKGDDAPNWARSAHPALAGGVGALFAVNTVTGTWNLWEGRHDPEGRTRRTLHGALMLLADAGFAATGALASGAGDDASRRDLHRNVALSSMGVALASYAIMLPLFGNR